VLKCLQPARLGHLHAAVLRLPGIERRRADPGPTADIGRLRPGLLLPQHSNDLLFREPRSLHGPVLPKARTLASRGGNYGGHVMPYHLPQRTQASSVDPATMGMAQ